MLKAIIFDFDFTLADSSKGVNICINYALKKLNLPAVSISETNKTIGLPLEDTFINLTFKNDLQLISQFKKLFVECADKEMVQNTFIYKDVSKIIKTLKKNKIKLGIVSTKFRYRIVEILKKNKLNEYFDLIVGGEDVKKPKPDPEGILLFIDMLKLEKDECVYIGDNIVDAESAKNSGISFIAVLTGTTKKKEFTNHNTLYFFNNLNDIIKHKVWDQLPRHRLTSCTGLGSLTFKKHNVIQKMPTANSDGLINSRTG